jgi:hypothetical protein
VKDVQSHNSVQLVRLLAILNLVLVGGAAIQNYQNGTFTYSNSWKLIGFTWVAIFLICSVFTLFSFTSHLIEIQTEFAYLTKKINSLKWFNLLVFSFFVLAFPYLVFSPIGTHFASLFFRIAVLWLLAFCAAFALKSLIPSKKFIHLFIFSILLIGAIFQSVSLLRDITTYAFSLAWSEGSRFYYASLPFSQKIYGQQIPWSFLHPSRYLFLSLPFMIHGLPLWIHRTWQIFLWISMTGLGCFALVRRLHSGNWLKAVALAAWAFIFLLQGPVYYHLMVCAILVLWGFDKENLKKSLIVVICASLWAGISRVNWFPVPAAIAILVFVLEKPYDQSRGFWDYLRSPVLFGLSGIAASLIAQAIYIPVSGNQDSGLFASSFTSDLLWYRLLPSPTFPMGILTGILLLCMPLIIYIAHHIFRKNSPLHFIRTVIILALLIVFFLGGLIVSVKIGGGSNLHNLDAFILLLICVGAYFLFDQVGKEKKVGPSPQWLPNVLLIALVMVPTTWALMNWELFPVYDKSAAYQDLQRLDATVQNVAASGQEVLFISERQLLTFEYIKNVRLVPDYELLTLMEMAISNNQKYLDKFYSDLKNQRFTLIVMNKQYVVFKDSTASFPEENNAWVKYITVPILEYYQPITWLRASGIEIYARRHLSSIQ